MQNPLMFSRAHHRSPIDSQQDFACRVVAVPANFRDHPIEFRGPRRELMASNGRFMLTRTDRRGDSRTIQWEARMSSIERYWGVSIPGGEEAPNLRRITIVASGERFDFKVSSRDGADLLTFLRDYAPQAVQVTGLEKYRAVDVLRSVATVAVVIALVIGFVHRHSGGSTAARDARTTPVAVVSVGECLDPLGQRTDCPSKIALIAVRRCSDVGAADRSLIASVIAGVPELSRVARVAARGRMCLTLRANGAA
jgi:hypothetical protein